ncbi:MAG: ACT domain-containing protein [Ruminococcus sp.]|nr:ACT domain-containing protein [Oscillospiraceae bacterium]MCI6388944.1 ACT domain-containing protein [Ruminococcus sp.]MDY4909839.1 ACT domain-containing protein [Candidatus Fimenecus sp.]MDD6271212.1 ACT domain-containing protein [Ruminococcus sp.]MDD7344625.1 ACT domain-containing protein [Ruminococcus sp.]
MRSIITVVGKDTVGILASVSELCAKHEVNIIEVSQSILQEMFCMIMLVDVSKCNVEFTAFADEAEKLGENKALKINVMHEDIFNSMHRI